MKAVAWRVPSQVFSNILLAPYGFIVLGIISAYSPGFLTGLPFEVLQSYTVHRRFMEL